MVERHLQLSGISKKGGLYDDLEERGALQDATPNAREALDAPLTCYVGFDPSSPSLHIGNLVPIIGLMRLQQHGHTPIGLIGTGTGLVGDPSGRLEERRLLPQADVEENAAFIRAQLERFLDTGVKRNPAKILENGSWLKGVTLIQFLRDTGKYFTVNSMMGRESVKARYERDSGISYAEFSYQLIQAYDYLHLYENEGCTMQMGGSDQWGNILSGVDLIRRKLGKGAHCIVYPLITGADGTKFGKTAGDAPTLDARRTSPYKLYQFFFNTADADAIRYIKLFTFLTAAEVEQLAHDLERRPKERNAQKALARAIVETVHGPAGVEQAEKVTAALFKGELLNLSSGEIADVFEGAPSGETSRDVIAGGTLSVEALLHRQGVFESLSEIRRTAKQGGLYLNGARLQDPQQRIITSSDVIAGKYIVFRRGQKSYHIVKVV